MRKLKKYFPLLIGLLTFFSVNQWSGLQIGNTALSWLLDITILFIVWQIKKNYYDRIFPRSTWKKDKILTLYFIWIIICVIRGGFVAENYWEWKQLINGTLTLMLPAFIYCFSIPTITHRTLQFWFKWILPFFIIYAAFFIVGDTYHFFLAPVLLIGVFLPILSKKWQVIIGFLLILMITVDIGARSQIIKALMCLMMSIAYLLNRLITDKLLRTTYILIIALPCIFLYLGISGIFNPFNMEDYLGERTRIVKREGKKQEEKITADTRTFIYIEVLKSATEHSYILQGRTPARGNDSEAFGSFNAEELKTGKYERHSNELCHLNVFTWTGLIGTVLYSLIYLISSWRAIYHSNNLYLKLLGVFVAFRWTYGWVEDFNRFDIMNITLWMMIAMCYSPLFRKLNNRELHLWIKSIL